MLVGGDGWLTTNEIAFLISYLVLGELILHLKITGTLQCIHMTVEGSRVIVYKY